MGSEHWHVVFVLGGMLLAALLAAGLAGLLRLPRVTAYLLAGLLLGPSVLGFVDWHDAEALAPLARLAIAIVLFNLGCHFPLTQARRILRRTLHISAGELGATFLVVSLGLLLVGARWEQALLLGVLALATAPATTILVLKETQSEGPVTDYANTLVAINNVVCIVAFELLLLVVFHWQGALSNPLLFELRLLGQDLIAAIALGIVGGLAISFGCGITRGQSQLVFMLAVFLILLALSETWEIPYLLTFLTCGVVVANSTHERRAVLSQLEQITGLLTVVFFVVHGSELQLSALVKAGALGVAYILLRCCGKYFGVWYAARASQEHPTIRNWLGATLLAQAGAAIALSAAAVHHARPIGGEIEAVLLEIQTIILGTVVVFEIGGPILIRYAVLRAGEVPLAEAIVRPAALPTQARSVWQRLVFTAGKDPWQGRSPESIKVAEFMRKNVRTVPIDAPFATVVDVIQHSTDHTYPVVERDGRLAGMIRYRELASALFDPTVGRLVIAADLATAARWKLTPEDTAAQAIELFRFTRDDCLPVVDEKTQVFLGIVRRRDLVRLAARGHSKGGSSH